MSNHSPDAGTMGGQPARLPLSALMGASRRVQDEKRDHSVDVNKMACRHEPGRPLAVCIHACKLCGQVIEPTCCTVCDGMGLSGTSDRRCVVCKGSGTTGWQASKWEAQT